MTFSEVTNDHDVPVSNEYVLHPFAWTGSQDMIGLKSIQVDIMVLPNAGCVT